MPLFDGYWFSSNPRTRCRNIKTQCPLNPELFHDKNVEHVLYSCLNGPSLHLCLVVKKNKHLVHISTSISRKALYYLKKSSLYMKAPSHTKDAFINGGKPALFE
jgi:hypothetical protein